MRPEIKKKVSAAKRMLQMRGQTKPGDLMNRAQAVKAGKVMLKKHKKSSMKCKVCGSTMHKVHPKHEKHHKKGNKNFIQKAIKHPGALHRELGVSADKKIPASKIKAAAKKGGKLGQRARFAETLAHLRK